MSITEELERLRKENADLSNQVKRLTWAERRMIESQEQLDQQIQIYRQINEMGQQLHACLWQLDAHTEIFRLTVLFVIYELNFERCLLLRYESDTQSYRAEAWDGYYQEAEEEALKQLVLGIDTPPLPQFHQELECLIAEVNHSQADLKALGETLGMDEYFLFALKCSTELPQFLVAIGNTAATAKHHTRVQPNSELMVVLNTLLSQISAAINQASLYAQVHARAEELQTTLHELQHAQANLIQSEKMSALGNLIAGVAHEINNPIGFLLGNLQPARDHTNDLLKLIDLYQQQCPNPSPSLQAALGEIDLEYLREDLPKLIDSMKLGIDRILGISTSLRTFSRADQDHAVPFNLHDGIDSTILILKHRLKANSSRPEIAVGLLYGELPVVNCFPGQINQVFMNLLANAIDALEESNVGRSLEDLQAHPNRIEIETWVDETASRVVVSIRDNGVGMPEAVRSRIFDHLFTTKAVGKGTGLGLAIAQQIVEETHAGHLCCLSQPGAGTEFQIQLPLL
ncbi:sensor histidine kinase [Myxacorys almedinensis]|uniref:sensor histidine kinase n=1 Tax=Myxacorys almedinensis TaxID=2651157 RepID=UPI001EE41AC8|nr:ATP-binding protein [Myxacorys almedinensis]